MGSGFWLFGVWGSRFSRFGVSGTGIRFQGVMVRGFGLDFQVSRRCFAFGVQVFRVRGFEVTGFGFGVSGFGFRGLGFRVGG